MKTRTQLELLGFALAYGCLIFQDAVPLILFVTFMLVPDLFYFLVWRIARSP